MSFNLNYLTNLYLPKKQTIYCNKIKALCNKVPPLMHPIIKVTFITKIYSFTMFLALNLPSHRSLLEKRLELTSKYQK